MGVGVFNVRTPFAHGTLLFVFVCLFHVSHIRRTRHWPHQPETKKGRQKVTALPSQPGLDWNPQPLSQCRVRRLFTNPLPLFSLGEANGAAGPLKPATYC